MSPRGRTARVVKRIFLSPIFLYHQHSFYRKMWDRKMAAMTEPNACLALSCD